MGRAKTLWHMCVTLWYPPIVRSEHARRLASLRPRSRRCFMDPQTIATTAVSVIAPYLTKAGEKAVEEVGKKLPETVGKLWRSMQVRWSGKPAAEEAAKDLVAAPEEPDNQAAFRKELRKLLETDSAFAVELVALLHSLQH